MNEPQIESAVLPAVTDEDVDTRQEDHIADEMRYLCQYDPIAPRTVPARTPVVFDPLDAGGVGRYDRGW